MGERGVEDDIAFIRRTIEGGRVYARGRSADLLVWGLFMAAGYLGTYAFVRHWWTLSPDWLWPICIAVPWAYSLRQLAARLMGRAVPARSPMARALAMLWLGSGISLLALSVARNWLGAGSYHEFDAAVAAILAIAFFAGSFLCNLSWMRFVALAWWLAVFVFSAVPDASSLLPIGAFLMLFCLAGPGLVLLRSARS